MADVDDHNSDSLEEDSELEPNTEVDNPISQLGSRPPALQPSAPALQTQPRPASGTMPQYGWRPGNPSGRTPPMPSPELFAQRVGPRPSVPPITPSRMGAQQPMPQRGPRPSVSPPITAPVQPPVTTGPQVPGPLRFMPTAEERRVQNEKEASLRRQERREDLERYCSFFKGILESLPNDVPENLKREIDIYLIITIYGLFDSYFGLLGVPSNYKIEYEPVPSFSGESSYKTRRRPEIFATHLKVIAQEFNLEYEHMRKIYRAKAVRHWFAHPSPPSPRLRGNPRNYDLPSNDQITETARLFRAFARNLLNAVEVWLQASTENDEDPSAESFYKFWKALPREKGLWG